jgi:hypothetical protein
MALGTALSIARVSIQLVLGFLIANKQALLLTLVSSALYLNYTGANDPCSGLRNLRHLPDFRRGRAESRDIHHLSLLGGIAASGPLSIVGGYFTYFFYPVSSGLALAISAENNISGPIIGPIIGGSSRRATPDGTGQPEIAWPWL